MHIFERTHVAAITLMSYVSRIHSKIIIAAQIAFVTHLYENQMAIPYIFRWDLLTTIFIVLDDQLIMHFLFLFFGFGNGYIEFTQVNVEITFRPKNAKAWLPSLSLN